MAGDWTRMRVMLPKDPKTIALADHLTGLRVFREWIGWLPPRAGQSTDVRGLSADCPWTNLDTSRTRNVTVPIVVMALLQVWGIARVEGRHDGCDLFLDFASLDTLDAMSGVPGFGVAMAHVSWAEQLPGRGVRFPKFFAENAPTDELRRTRDAERKRRERELLRAANKTDTPAPPTVRGQSTDASTGASADTSADNPRTVTDRGEDRIDLFTDPPKEGRKGSAKKPKTAKPRRQDELWDAIAEVTNSDSRASATHIGKVCSLLREADPPYTPAEVRALPGILGPRGFSTPLSLGTVEKYIGWSRKIPVPAGQPSSSPPKVKPGQYDRRSTADLSVFRQSPEAQSQEAAGKSEPKGVPS